MKHYELYVFEQESCAPCQRLKAFVNTLTEAEQNELHFMPLKVEGQYTDLAEELKVNLSPTLVVCSLEKECEVDEDGEEYCEQFAQPVFRYIGQTDIIENLDGILESFTYAHPD